MFDGTEDWCEIWRKTDLCFLKTFLYRLKNSDFILESKIAEINWSRIYWLILKIARMFPILTSRNRLMNTFIIVKLGLTSPFSLERNRIYLGSHLKEELTNLFWKLRRYSLFIPIQAEYLNILLMVNVNPTSKR